MFLAFRHFLTCRFLCVLYFEKLLLLHPWHFFPRFYTKLELIDLSHNKIVAVQDSSFTRSFNLKKLNLEGNKISKVTNETFAGLSKLQSLSLRKNEIVSLPAGAFSSNVPSLVGLDLSGNRITEISNAAFDGGFSGRNSERS